MMKNLLVSVSVAAVLAGGYAWAGSPVTINNPANTQTAIVDSAGLHVVCDTGCVASSGSPSAVNLVGINGAAPSLTNPIFTAFAEAGDTTGTFTNATQTTSVTASNGDGYGTALISINGTYNTATAVFEVSDDGGTTWYSAIATRSDNVASETGYTALTNTNRQWQVALGGNDSIRVRSTAVASGTVNVRISITAVPSATTVNGTVNTIIPTSSITASTTAGQCTVACASLIVSGAHNLYGAGFSSTATGWLLLEDATSCAANGTITPLRAYAYPTAGVTQTLSWGDVPRSVATGVALCFSTTGPYTATASTTAFIWADYK